MSLASGNENPKLHGLAGGEKPQRPDWTIDQDWDSYSADDHGVWKFLYERQMTIMPGRACRSFVEGLKALPILSNTIPRFDELSDVLMKATGWQIVAVPGLIPDDVFFDHLANRRFPAGQFIRKSNELDYLQEPDVFHDVFGHVPLLYNPVMADFICAYGKGGLRALEMGVLDHLARLYWYTVEFGLVREDGDLRIFGAGILSSYSETLFCLEDQSPHRVNLDLSRVMRTRYRIDDFQEIYFILESLDQLLGFANIDFLPLYTAVKNQPDLKPFDLDPHDKITHKGTGDYARNVLALKA
jgi:phenylalanine-4-hydroxylase